MKACHAVTGRQYSPGNHLAFLLKIFLLLGISVSGFAYYEARPVIRMSDVLTSQQAQSVYHRVEDIEFDGRFYRFHVDSEMGQYDITSLALFRKRVQELLTLSQAINQFQKEDEGLSEELDAQFSIRANSAIDIISRPVESAANLAGQVAENLNQTFTGPQGKSTGFSYLGQESNDPVAAMHKRNVASQWGLDVYSRNLNVQEFLNAVTRARSAGRISAGTPSLRSQLNRPQMVADSEIEANTTYLLKSKSVGELREINTALLRRMKVNADVIAVFLDHPSFTPRNVTRITHYVAALEGVRNRAAFIEAAVDVQDEVMALVFEDVSMMLKYYHEHIVKLEKLFAGDEVLEAVTADRKIVYFLPVDMIYWTEKAENLFELLRSRAQESGFVAWELVTAGAVTAEAGKQLQSRDFVLRDNFTNR